jgi:putative restriction endonuclease
MERDESLRAACFLALDALRARHGDDLPLRGGLDQGFAHDGARVPFLNPQKGIFRAARQRGPEALTLVTSYRSPYGDEATADGISYAYRAGSIDQPDNRALRAAHETGVPLVYLAATRPGWFRAVYPCFVTEDDPHAARVVVTPGAMRAGEPVLGDDPLDRRYRTRETLVRLHQGRFRAIVLPAYRERCAVCRLREPRLLDAAHIAPDAADERTAAVSNGLSLCSIHHRAFDQQLVGISPDLRVHVARRLLDDEDGPMLDLLKGAHGRLIDVPSRVGARPDRERLAVRFERFLAA